MTATYSVGTWDSYRQHFSPVAINGRQSGSLKLDWLGLLKCLKHLRRCGYECDSVKDENGEHEGDPSVIVERTDGETAAEVFWRWRRGDCWGFEPSKWYSQNKRESRVQT